KGGRRAAHHPGVAVGDPAVTRATRRAPSVPGPVGSLQLAAQFVRAGRDEVLRQKIGPLPFRKAPGDKRIEIEAGHAGEVIFVALAVLLGNHDLPADLSVAYIEA